MVSPKQQPTTYTNKGEIIMSAGDGRGEIIPLIHDEQGNVRVNVFFPDYNIQKCFTFDPDENVWDAKKMVLEEFSEQLHDPLNYGLYISPIGGKAGKFLDEERPLDDYKLSGPVGQLEFKYKRRVYRVSNLNYRKLRQLHNKGTLKHFCEIVKGNSLDKVTKFLEKGIDPNFIDQETGETPLTLATKVPRCRSLILQLVSGGAHIDFRNKRSLTPVHTAALNGNAEAIKALLELGASPNYRDGKGLTPLYHLSKKRNSPALCAELLLRDYAHIGCKDDTGNTELHQTCKVGNYRVAEMLIFYGAELDYQSNTGATPLHVSAFNNELGCLQTLLVRGADKQMMNNARQTPFDVANISGNKDAANILEKHDELLVVPFEESPMYNTNRRLAGANLEAMRLLSKSDPRINLSASVMNLSTSDNLILNVNRLGKNDSMMRSELGHLGLYDSLSVSRSALHRGSCSIRSDTSLNLPNTVPGRTFICTCDYDSDAHGHLKLTKGDLVTVLTVGDDGMWEGKVGEKEGWFPPENVAEAKRQTLTSRSKSVNEDSAANRQWNYSAAFSQESSRGESLRTVVLSRTKKGYGFVLRGAKAEQLRKLNVQFVPSEKMPALQYLDSVEKGSVSDKAGLRAGDFILEIDQVNVVHASHEQTVQIIKKAGDMLAMKVIRAVLTRENASNGIVNGSLNGSINGSINGSVNGSVTLPHKKAQKEPKNAPGSSSDVLTRKKPTDSTSNTNGLTTDEERIAIDQLDATLANYDSDSRSSGSGAIPTAVTFREPKTASIRQRPNSSHFNSIQELDDMFASPAPAQPSVPADKSDSRKPAKSRVKKFWSKGKTNSKLSKDNKPLSLSQPNLAALDRGAEVKPITMYEMSVGHSIDAEGQTAMPRTLSGDLSLLRRKSFGEMTTSPILPPPPPTYPAPTAPDDDRNSQISSNSTGSRSGSSGLHSAQNTLLRNQQQINKRFLPRTPLPAEQLPINSSSPNPDSPMSSDGGTLQRGKVPPPPPQRSCSHESGVILAMQGQSVVQNSGTVTSSPNFSALNQSNSFTLQPTANQTTGSSPFSDAIRKAAAEREADRSANNNSTTGAINGDVVYAVVQKRQDRTGDKDGSSPTTTESTNPGSTNGGGGSVEDQLRLAVARRRTLIEQREPSTESSDKSHSVTPERTISPATKETPKTESTNFRELAEQKRLEFLKKKADSRDRLQPTSAASSRPVESSTDENLTELQKIMSRLSVVKADEPNNNIKKKPPTVMKKPGKPSQPTVVHEHLSPVEEFPPPPPPHDFGSNPADIIIPPPSFEVATQPAFSPQSLSPQAYSTSKPETPHHHHDADNHSVTSSVGSDTISSVSQDGNRLSVATSGYGSDPSRSTKLSFSGKNVELWNTDEVGEWLDAIGLGEYKYTFADNCIEGETLVSMSKSDVKELGVEKVGHRVKLDKEIRKLVAESSA